MVRIALVPAPGHGERLSPCLLADFPADENSRGGKGGGAEVRRRPPLHNPWAGTTNRHHPLEVASGRCEDCRDAGCHLRTGGGRPVLMRSSSGSTDVSRGPRHACRLPPRRAFGRRPAYRAQVLTTRRKWTVVRASGLAAIRFAVSPRRNVRSVPVISPSKIGMGGPDSALAVTVPSHYPSVGPPPRALRSSTPCVSSARRQKKNGSGSGPARGNRLI